MNAKEFEKWVVDKKTSVGMWSIESNKKSLKQFTIGCYFDDQEKKWKVYSTGERNKHKVYLVTDDEDEAYEKLQARVIFEQRNNKGYY